MYPPAADTVKTAVPPASMVWVSGVLVTVSAGLGIAPDLAGTFTRAEAEPCLQRLNRLLPVRP